MKGVRLRGSGVARSCRAFPAVGKLLLQCQRCPRYGGFSPNGDTLADDGLSLRLNVEKDNVINLDIPTKSVFPKLFKSFRI